VTPDKGIVGQTVNDGTMQDVAPSLRLFEPPAPVQIERVALPDSAHELLLLRADASHESWPFTFDGRPYERIGSTTSVMPQEKYQRLLLERAHSSQRWENLPASCSLEELDQEEIFKTVRLGVTAGRMSPSASPDVADVLDRLGLRVEGQVLNAAVVVFGGRMLPHYAQCQLRMARFRGTDKTEFLDQRQTNGHALQLLEEASQFSRGTCQSRAGLNQRVRAGGCTTVPPVALREALVNAFCHRDYSIVGSSVSLAIYDDRLEIWSDGTLPFGLSVDGRSRRFAPAASFFILGIVVHPCQQRGGFI
jgi:ATP-dependent DNA helicase RecG